MTRGRRVGGAAASLLLPVLALAALWQGSVVLFHVSPAYLPSLSVVLGQLASQPGAYASAFLHTLLETLVGFAAGAVIGVAAGIAFAELRLLREMLFPLMIVSQTIPVIAFGAIVVLWFGNGLAAKAVIAFYLTFFPVVVNTLIGLQSVDPAQLALLRSFGAGRRQAMRMLKLPAALPQIFVALRLGASLSLVGAVVGEWFGDTNGLGTLLLSAMFNEQIPGLWAAIFASAMLGLLCYGAVVLAEQRLVFWAAEL